MCVLVFDTFKVPAHRKSEKADLPQPLQALFSLAMLLSQKSEITVGSILGNIYWQTLQWEGIDKSQGDPYTFRSNYFSLCNVPSPAAFDRPIVFRSLHLKIPCRNQPQSAGSRYDFCHATLHGLHPRNTGVAGLAAATAAVAGTCSVPLLQSAAGQRDSQCD